jgi:hypothetical protein
MNCFLVQTIVLARGSDLEGWMDILVLVVIAVVYGLGALFKAKSKKTEENTRPQQLQKPQSQPSKGGRGLFEQFFMEVKQAANEAKKGVEMRPSNQKVPPKTPHSQAVVQKYSTTIRQESPIQSKIPTAKLQSSKPTGKVQSDFEKSVIFDKGVQALPEISTNVDGLRAKKKKVTPANISQTMHLSEVLADYEDPEELKKAILHYEILGRPLALRDSSRDVIGL